VICRNRHRRYKETDHRRYEKTDRRSIHILRRYKETDTGDLHTDTGHIKIWTHRHRICNETYIDLSTQTQEK
jgi:hypothetical protein